MPTVAIIPVKSFALGKQRLSEALSDDERATLGKAMVEHVTEVATGTGLIPVLVTADPDVATWAAGRAIPSVPESGGGLDAAASAGVRWANESASRWVVLHSDLPLLAPGDLHRLLSAAQEGDAIAPSADGGTSAITSTRAIEFSFGPGSFARHLARLRSPVVVALPGFLHDVDSPGDLVSARAHARGRWIDQLLA